MICDFYLVETGSSRFLFDPTEAKRTNDFNPDNADLVLIPSGGGKFKHDFVSTYIDILQPENYNKWINAETGLPEKPSIPYGDAFFRVEVKGARQ